MGSNLVRLCMLGAFGGWIDGSGGFVVLGWAAAGEPGVEADILEPSSMPGHQ